MTVYHDGQAPRATDDLREGTTLSVSLDGSGNGSETFSFVNSFASVGDYTVHILPNHDGLGLGPITVTKNTGSVQVSISGASVTSTTVDLEVTVDGWQTK